MESIHKQEHRNALIVRQDQHAEMDIDILVSQVVILPVVNLHVSLVPQGLSPHHLHHQLAYCVPRECMQTTTARPVLSVKVDTTVRLGYGISVVKGLSQLPNKAIALHVHQGLLVTITLLFPAKEDTPVSTESRPCVL
jgi:hypothetical protein